MLGRSEQNILIRTIHARGFHPPKSHIAYSPSFRKIHKCPPYFRKAHTCHPYFRKVYVLLLNSRFFASPYFDAFMRHAQSCTRTERPWSTLPRLYLRNSFIHSGHFYSAPSSPLLLRGAPDYSTDTVSEFHAEAHRQLQVKDLPKVPTWRLERESNPRP